MSEEIQKMKYVKAVKFLTELGHIDSLINQIEEDYQNTCFKAQPKGITYDKVGTSGNGFHSQTEEVAVLLAAGYEKFTPDAPTRKTAEDVLRFV